MSNLKDRRYATQWMSNSSANNQEIRFGPLVAKSMLIANHNFANLNNIYIEYNNGQNWITVTTYSSFTDPLWVDLSSVSSYVVWRIRFNTSVAPMIGMIFLGLDARPNLYLNQFQRGIQNVTSVDESLSGLVYGSQTRAEREVWSLDMSSLKAAQNADMARLLRTIQGQLYPFWFCDMDGNWHFVRSQVDTPMAESNGNVTFQFKSLQFAEERIGISLNLPGGYTV